MSLDTRETLFLRECILCHHWWIDPIPRQQYLSRLYENNSLFVVHKGFDEESKLSKINNNRLIQYANKVRVRCLQDKITKFFFVWDNDVSKDPGVKEIIKLLHQNMKDIAVIILHGHPDEIAKAIFSEASKD